MILGHQTFSSGSFSVPQVASKPLWSNQVQIPLGSRNAKDTTIKTWPGRAGAHSAGLAARNRLNGTQVTLLSPAVLLPLV